MFAYSFLLASCSAQSENENKTTDNASSNKNEPQENITINKTFDENGNLIQYDSTYTYFYSNIEGKPEIADSIFGEFRKEFNTQYPFLSTPFFDDYFFDEAFLQKHFYMEDFFSNSFKENLESMNKLFMNMDSMKNQFFENQFPQSNDKTN
jgi:hypothetical protein